MTTIYVDADACPVRAEAQRVAERHRLPMVVVSNGGMRPAQHPLVETVVVAEGPDAADRWIAERIGPGDICVTADIPLAARCLEAGGRASAPTATSSRPPTSAAPGDARPDGRHARRQPAGRRRRRQAFLPRRPLALLQALDRMVVGGR